MKRKEEKKGKKKVLRTNKGVQHLLVRDVPMKGKSWEHTAKVKANVGPQPAIRTHTKLHQAESKHMKNQAEKGIKLAFLCSFLNKGSGLILSWIFISVCTLLVLSEC